MGIIDDALKKEAAELRSQIDQLKVKADALEQKAAAIPQGVETAAKSLWQRLKDWFKKLL